MGDGTDETETTDTTETTDDSADEQDLVDRDKIDFDPDDGLYSGTAVDGTTDIPGPHEGAPDKDDDNAASG
jgi:hypothetical protein